MCSERAIFAAPKLRRLDHGHKQPGYARFLSVEQLNPDPSFDLEPQPRTTRNCQSFAGYGRCFVGEKTEGKTRERQRWREREREIGSGSLSENFEARIKVQPKDIG